jgi:hypothetical protein
VDRTIDFGQNFRTRRKEHTPQTSAGVFSFLSKWVIRLTPNTFLHRIFKLRIWKATKFTVAGQRRIYTELPPLSELFSCVRTEPHGQAVGNQTRTI